MVSILGGRRWRSNAVPRVRPPATGPYGHRWDMELNGPGGGWTDVTADVLLKPTGKIAYGISGTGPTDLMAKTGAMSFALNNAENNTGGVIGYYTPDGTHVRPGFSRGIGVRYRYVVPNSYDFYLKFVGRLLYPQPEPGRQAGRSVDVDAVDWMYDAGNAKLNLPVQTNKRADEVLNTILNSLPTSPGYRSFDVGDSTFTYALNNRGEQPVASAEILRLMQSELGRFYLKGGLNTDFMTARFERRGARLVPFPVASFIGTMKGLVPKNDIRNKAIVTGHPSTTDVSDVILYSKPSVSNPSVQPAQQLKISGRYTDPTNRNAKVSALSHVLPLVAGTDYKMTANADGTGADLTANFSVVPTVGANQTDFVVTNNGVVVAYVVILQQRGKAIYDYTPTPLTQQNAASILLNGESVVSLDMVYQPDLAIVDAVAEYLVDTWSTPGFAAAELKFTPHDRAELALCMSLEPGDPISISEDVTGVNGVYYIQAVEISILENGWAAFEFSLQRALVSDYWTLGVSGHSELGITTVLAPL